MRRASPTARGPSPRSQRETTPRTMRKGVAPNGTTPAKPAVRIAAATRSSGRRNRWVRKASRTPPGATPLDEGSIDRLPRELGREDSNLQLPKATAPPAKRVSHRENNLADGRSRGKGQKTPKSDPETVTRVGAVGGLVSQLGLRRPQVHRRSPRSDGPRCRYRSAAVASAGLSAASDTASRIHIPAAP